MNAYDFDKTIFSGDSTAQFFLYCLIRTPKMLLHIPHQAANAFMFVTGMRDKLQFKEQMYTFLLDLPDVDQTVANFWEKKISRIKHWYHRQRKQDDVVISASPEFLLRPACNRLGIKYLIASRVDPYTGKYFGLNCHGEEKVLRFRQVFPNAQVDEFYSDSYSDLPMAKIAKKAFLVKGNTPPSPWNPFI